MLRQSKFRGLFPSVFLVFALFTNVSGASLGADRLSFFLQGLTTYKAHFVQSVLDTENARSGLFKGTFYLSRPGRFRWEYEPPYEQLIIADGDTLWVVDNDLEQVTQQSQHNALKGTPALVLTGDIAVDEEFEIIDLGERLSLDWLELLPRDQESQFIRILLAFKDDQLTKLEMSDKFGQVTRFVFTEIERNPVIEPELFSFTPPNLFDVYDQ